MRKSDCSRAEQLIIRELDEGLDPGKRELLEKHLLDCASCRTVREETRKLLTAVASDVPREPSEEFWKHYHVSLNARVQEKAIGRDRGFLWKAAGALLLATLAFVAIRAVTSEPGKSPTLETETVVALVQDLDRLYGPQGEEIVASPSSGDGVLETLAANLPRNEELSLSWFEVEDESNNLFL